MTTAILNRSKQESSRTSEEFMAPTPTDASAAPAKPTSNISTRCRKATTSACTPPPSPPEAVLPQPPRPAGPDCGPGRPEGSGADHPAQAVRCSQPAPPDDSSDLNGCGRAIIACQARTSAEARQSSPSRQSATSQSPRTRERCEQPSSATAFRNHDPMPVPELTAAA